MKITQIIYRTKTAVNKKKLSRGVKGGFEPMPSKNYKIVDMLWASSFAVSDQKAIEVFIKNKKRRRTNTLKKYYHL